MHDPGPGIEEGIPTRLGPELEHSILAMDGRYGCRDRVPAERVRAWAAGVGEEALA